MSDICGILMPHEALIVGIGPQIECLRPREHHGDHVSLNERGKFYRWAFVTELCGTEDTCACAASDGLIECFTYQKISKREAQKLIKSLTSQ